MPQIHAPETIAARSAIDQKYAVSAVIAVFGTLQIITPITTHAVIAEFATNGVGTIDAIPGMVHPLGIQTIFGDGRMKDEVAIFDACRIIGIVAIFHLNDAARWSWQHLREFGNL